MKCHYEVLNVSRDADDSEIKTAYRKLALKWHPDKNLESPDLAKEQFQIVQQAYDVLSDRQERAWYDNHREQILRGSSTNFEDTSLDVFQYFSATCFQGFGDDENGFYAVYRNIFEKLAKEDMDFMEDKEEFCEIPNFGNSKTDFQNVSEFYAFWLNYSTKKSFVWLDPYDIKDIRDRRYLKLAEKDNKKVRQKAKKERNEEIRNLAAFVKKRDKRVQAQKKIQEQKLLEDKKKREMMSKQKKLERQEELAKARISDQAEWTKFDNFKSELEQIERNLVEEFGEFSVSEEDEDDLDNLYCIACSKLFKTPKAFQNHESSKKHKENMDILKGTMLAEEDGFENGSSEEYEELSEENEKEVSEENENKVLEENEKVVLEENENKLSEENERHSEHSEDIEDTESNETLNEPIKESNGIHTDSINIEDTPGKNKKKKKKSTIMNIRVEESHSILNFEVSSDEFEFNSSSKKQKKKSKKMNTKTKTTEDIRVETEENCPKETPIFKNKKDKKKKSVDEIPEMDINHHCVTCKSSFTSKNKLFDHLKKTGHGIYIPPNVKNKNKNGIKSK